MPESYATAALSFAQERLWVLAQLTPHSSAYNLRAAFDFEGPLDPEWLERALNRCIARHEALRTAFDQVDGVPRQKIAPSLTIALETIDLRATSADELFRLTTERVAQPFDLERLPLLRPTLFRLEESRYRLLVVFHHIVFDGWSAGVFLDELLTGYEALTAPDGLEEPLVLRYRDFVDRQRAELTEAELDRLLTPWVSRLDGAPTVLELPADRPRPLELRHRGAVAIDRLNSDETRAVQGFGGAQKSSPFMILMAAFGALLGRYTGEEDLLIGTPIAGRNRADLEEMIGLFVNSLVLRIDLSGDPTFRELVSRVRDAALDAFDYQELPFEKLVARLQPSRDLARSPLFQVFLLFQNAPSEPIERAGLVARPVEVPFGTARFDLSLALTPREGGLDLAADYDADLFDAGRIEDLLGNFRILVAAAVAAPETPISRLEMISPNERDRLLGPWSQASSAGCSKPGRLDERFRRQAALSPEGVALRTGQTSLSFGEIDRWSNRVAARLSELGAGPGEVVGVAMERSPEAVVAILAVLKAGAAYLPLEPDLPEARRRFMVEEAGVSLVLTRGEFFGLEGIEQVVRVDDAALTDGPDPGPPSLDRADDVAYVLYTSGSTGRPKGVRGQHSSTINRLEWMWNAFPFAPGEVCCQKTALSFVDSVSEIFGPLLAGVPSTFVTDEEVRDPRLLLERLSGDGVTRLVLVPSLLRSILTHAGGDLGRHLPELRLWVLSGEPLAVDLVREWRGAVGGSPVLLNLYGSTEVAGDVLWHEVSELDDQILVPLGRPIDGTRIFVLDRRMQPVPTGVSGELYVGGAGLASGYIGQASLTAESFVPSPFDDSLLYRTGDLVRYRADGVVEFLGRADRQLKLRGYRIEPAEIESVLAEHVAVAEAAVVAGKNGSQELIGYYVAKGVAIGVPALRAWLTERLPGYMVPAALVEIGALPVTPTGKIDRQRLPDPQREDRPGATSADQAVGATDELGVRLTNLFKQLLAVERVGPRDDFFDLGGHSLKAVELLSRIEGLTGTQLPLASLMRGATVERLTELLESEGWASTWVSLVPIEPEGSKRPFFCVPGAGGHLLFYRELSRYLDSDRPFYGLQARGLDSRHAADRSIGEMASHYIEEMRAMQPEGPYLIGGSCLGGSVAYEMALQLEDAGQGCALVLLESYAPQSSPKPETLKARVATRLRRLRLGRQVTVGDLFRRTRRWLQGKPSRPVDSSLQQTVTEVIRASTAAVREYRPRSYGGRVVLFQGLDRPAGYSFPQNMGWSDYVENELELHNVPGFHTGVFREPAVRILATSLSDVLDSMDG